MPSSMFRVDAPSRAAPPLGGASSPARLAGPVVPAHEESLARALAWPANQIVSYGFRRVTACSPNEHEVSSTNRRPSWQAGLLACGGRQSSSRLEASDVGYAARVR